MGQTDHIVKDLIIDKKAQFNMIDLYRTLKAWFDLNEYDFSEKEYEDVIKGDKKSVKIKWEGQKVVDDYNKYKIALKIDLKNYENIETKEGKNVEGDLKISFSADLEEDYEDKWSHHPIAKFSRAVFDKYVATGKREKNEKRLKEECYDIFNRTKTYLNLQKFK